MKLLPWLVAILSARAWAAAEILDPKHKPVHDLGLRENGDPNPKHTAGLSSIQKRTVGSLCSAPRRNTLNVRSEPEKSQQWERNYTVQKRQMTVPTGSMDAFMEGEQPEVTVPIIWGKETTSGEIIDMATAEFEEFKDKAFSFGTRGLCGCTVLAIISRKAVYMAHYWEDLSFSPSNDSPEKDPEKAFKNTVIKGLEQGVRNEQVSLKNQATKLTDDYVKAYLMIVSEGPQNELDPYRAKWNAIKSKVGDLVPKLKDASRWEEVKYERLDNTDDKLKETAHGTILFKFDPEHDFGDGESWKITRLWIEHNTNAYHKDQWT